MKKTLSPLSQEKILAEHEKRADDIIKKMLHVLIRAQRKVDDVAYRKALDSLNRK